MLPMKALPWSLDSVIMTKLKFSKITIVDLQSLSKMSERSGASTVDRKWEQFPAPFIVLVDLYQFYCQSVLEKEMKMSG